MVSNSDAWSSPCSRCDTLCLFSAYHTAPEAQQDTASFTTQRVAPWLVFQLWK